MPNLVEIVPMVLEKKIFKFYQYIFTILLLSPLGKERGLALMQGYFVLSLVEIGPVVLEKK